MCERRVLNLQFYESNIPLFSHFKKFGNFTRYQALLIFSIAQRISLCDTHRQKSIPSNVSKEFADEIKLRDILYTTILLICAVTMYRQSIESRI